MPPPPNRITIPRDSVKRTKLEGGKWKITVKVCNGYNVEKAVEVRQNPYMAPDGVKLYRSHEVPVTAITIPAESCQEVSWEYDAEPIRSYTDASFPGTSPLYEDGEETDFKKKDASVKESSSAYLIVPIQTPYPWRLYYLNGPNQTATFVVQSVSGLPAGWSAEVLYPGLNVEFQRTDPDRCSEGVLRVVRPMNTPEGTVVTVAVLQRVVGQPDEPVYRFESQYFLVADTTPPTVVSQSLTPNYPAKTILATVVATDPVSDVLSVEARFSTNGGATWASRSLLAPASEVYATQRSYSGTLGPFCSGQTVAVEAVVTDNLLNRTTVNLGSVQF